MTVRRLNIHKCENGFDIDNRQYEYGDRFLFSR